MVRRIVIIKEKAVEQQMREEAIAEEISPLGDIPFQYFGQFSAKLEEASGDWYPTIFLNGKEVDGLPNEFDPLDTPVIEWIDARGHLSEPSSSLATRAHGTVYRNALGGYRYVVDYVEVTTIKAFQLGKDSDPCVFDAPPVTEQ
jgi:hypothetical protein